MWQQLLELRRERPFSVRRINVDDDQGLVDEFGTLVPVLAAGDEILCHYYLDAKTLGDYLDRS